MILKYRLTAILIGIILMAGCAKPPGVPGLGNATQPPQPAPTEPEDVSPIGTVSNIRTNVYAGAPDNLVPVEGERDLGNNDYVTVEDGGKARLEFPGPIRLLLYNQSEMDNIQLEYENTSNPRIVNRLIRGGYSGYVEPGNQLTIDLAFGVEINVLGTNFFVLYDDEKNIITVGKFDGTLTLSVPGQPTVALSDLEMIDVGPQGILARYANISFNFERFEEAADACLSPIQAVKILRSEHNLPLPGQTTAEVDTDLACDPMPGTVPNTGGGETQTPGAACLQPIGHVTVSKVWLLEGPDLRFVSMGIYQKNEQFTVLGHYRRWYNVQFPDGKKGWLYSDWINIPSEDNICTIPYRDLPPTPTRPPVCRPSTYVVCP